MPERFGELVDQVREELVGGLDRAGNGTFSRQHLDHYKQCSRWCLLAAKIDHYKQCCECAFKEKEVTRDGVGFVSDRFLPGELEGEGEA